MGASSSAPATAASSSSVAWSTRCAARSKCRTAWSSATPACRPRRRIEFRVGIHLGDVVEESDGDLMGDGVNIAARLEGSPSRARSVCPKTPIVRSRGGSISRSAISARPNSRTSPSRSGSIRSKSASRPGEAAQQRRKGARAQDAVNASAARSPGSSR